MFTPASRPLTVLLALVVALGGLAEAAPAQSQGDLRRENQTLRAQVNDLQRELEAAQRRIEELEAELTRVRQAAADARAAGRPPRILPPEQKEELSIDESKPDASPRALLRALADSYREALGEMEPGDEGSRQRVAFMRALRSWATRASREMRMPVEWTVRIVDPGRRAGRGYVVRLQAVDPVTDVNLGDPFDALVPRAVAHRLQQRPGQTKYDDVLVCKGVARPQVNVNPDRESEGPFDNPRFIGPYAEHVLALEVQTLIPPPRPDETANEDAGDASGAP